MKNFALMGAAGYIAPRHLKAIKDTGNKRFLKCCRWYSSRLPILRPLHGKQYGMGGVFFDKLMNICDGKILTLEKEALLRFPIRCSCAVSGGIHP